MNETYESVLEAICDTTGEAENIRARAELMLGIREPVKEMAHPAESCSSAAGLTRLQLNDLMRGKVDKFSLEVLVNIAMAAGSTQHIELVAA